MTRCSRRPSRLRITPLSPTFPHLRRPARFSSTTNDLRLQILPSRDEVSLSLHHHPHLSHFSPYLLMHLRRAPGRRKGYYVVFYGSNLFGLDNAGCL